MKHANGPLTLIDCTLRDGGYYNSWDFPRTLISQYLSAMAAAQIDIVELGFRFLENRGFKGPCAYTTDDFIRSLNVPERLQVAVMVNGSDLLTELGLMGSLSKLFPETSETSPVDIVRFACHFAEFEKVLPAVGWLHERGYRVGFNLMQISDRTQGEIQDLAAKARDWPIEVLYFADSMGGMTPQDAAQVVAWIREGWDGPIGVHTHDNMGLALANALSSFDAGASWIDSTVTGMGRGPGNARTEEVVIEAEALRGRRTNMVPLMRLIRNHFGPMKVACGWGTNPYYYLSGKYGIHPTYIQEMLGDARFDEEDMLAVIDHLRAQGGKKFSSGTLDGARQFYQGPPRGTWLPAKAIEGRDVLILGTGPSVADHRDAIESYVFRHKPLVIALNTLSEIEPELIDLRIACHPVRLLADAEDHVQLPQPLITPASMLSEGLRAQLGSKKLLDFGLSVDRGRFAFHDTHCVVPNSLVISYALAVATSGKATRILVAGLDGYPPGDERNEEIENTFAFFFDTQDVPEIVSITPTRYKRVSVRSIYAM